MNGGKAARLMPTGNLTGPFMSERLRLLQHQFDGLVLLTGRVLVLLKNALDHQPQLSPHALAF